MFRQEEVILGGWQEKTIEAMQRRRFDTLVSRLPPLGARRLEALSSRDFAKRIEGCWQEIERKPMKAQMITAVKKSVLGSIRLHADCLSREEHDLVERALILGGCARIGDTQELEAAAALSLRLWGSVGLISGRPYIDLDHDLLVPIAKEMARTEHERIRRRFDEFNDHLAALLYRYGAIDDRIPQRIIQREILCAKMNDEQSAMLARRYLWATCDCIDYGGNVVLLHPALADPRDLLASGWRISAPKKEIKTVYMGRDILPEEIPLQEALERAIQGTLRDGVNEKDISRTIRFLCKQGAPLTAMEEVLQSALIVLITPAMKGALHSMYCLMPKWIESGHDTAVQ